MVRQSLRDDRDKYEIGNNIRDRRMAMGLSQDDLGDMLGVDANTVSRHENGTREMKVSTFCQYVDALGADPVSLFPERYQKKEKSQVDELYELAQGLDPAALEILIATARRFGKG